MIHDLWNACSGLGDYHKVDGKQQYYYRSRDECMTSLGDVDVLLKQHDSPENGYMLRRKLGEWQVLRTRIIPLFIAYFKDSELVTNVVQLMVLLTTRVGLYGAEELEHLQHLQDYKEGFSKSEVFTILVRLLLDALDQEVGGQRFFKDVLVLIRNLVSVPDPGPGDAGFTPLRSRLQLTYIRHFFDEGVLSFFHFLGEQLVLREEDADQVWALADILYHICAHFDPQEMWQSRRGRNKSELAELLARDKADSKLITSQSSRHSRFGTSMQTFSADGSLNVSASVMQKSIIQKSSALLKKEFRNPLGTDKKQNMFHNPFFVDLAEGSVREHNQLNPHVRGSLDDRASHSERILQGYRSFLEQCTFLSSLISILRSTVSSKEGSGAGKEFNVPHLLNFVSWFLEFHRCQHAAQVAEAKKKNAEPPDLDIANLQGAIDVDMIQFTTARLREFGKVGMHHSQLMIVLRVLSQQVQIIKVTSECSGSDTRDCGDILVRHLVKADIMANLAWIMKNFKSSTHDPRILSYSVEVWDQMIILMNRLCERYSQEDFQVDRQRGVHTVLANTTVENEVSGLTDSRVVENLFHLLEKYRRLSPQLQSMLVELIYSIVKAHHTNIVLFFELSFFMRIYRIMTDPLLTSTKNNTKYKDLIGLLQFILQSFFQCAQVNSCVFAELLFRKVQEKGVVESTAEFAAILDNYEDDTYRRDVLDRIGAGDTLNEMKMKQKELQKGQQPWTDEEDNILKENHARYAEHPLYAELIAAELPETSNRTLVQVRRRLAELGLTSRGRDKAAEEDQPPSKKVKVSEVRLEEEEGQEGPAPASPGTPKHHAEREEEEMLEEDLERLLDAAYDSCPRDEHAGVGGSTAAAATGSAAGTMMDPSGTQGVQDSQDGLKNLEMELERMMEEVPSSAQQGAGGQASGAPKEVPESLAGELAKGQGKSPMEAAPPSRHVPDSLELELEQLIDEEEFPCSSSRKSQEGQGTTATEAVPPSSHVPCSLELELEQLMDDMSATAPTQEQQGAFAEEQRKVQDMQEQDVEDMPVASRAGA